ncbi:hypothetical protein OROHE_018135 [Orobanche hederae]
MPSQEILKIRDGTPLEAISRNSKIRDGAPLEAEEILTYIKKPSKRIGWHFYSKLDVPSNVLQKKRVAGILFFKIRTSQEILRIRDDISLEEEEILIYIKKLSKRIEILKIRDGTPLEKKIVAQILFFKIRPSQEILKIRDGTTLEAEEIMIYIKKPSKRIEPSQEILKLRDDVPNNVVHKKRVALILFFKIRPSQEILKIRDGTPLEVGRNFDIHKNPRNGSVWHFSSKLDVPSNVVQKKRVARILFFKIRTSQEILKICDSTHLEAEKILTYIKNPSKRIGLALF